MESLQELPNCGPSKAPFLINVIQAKPEQASMQNPLCEIAMTKEGPAPVFPDKLGAAAQLANSPAGIQSRK